MLRAVILFIIVCGTLGKEEFNNKTLGPPSPKSVCYQRLGCYNMLPPSVTKTRPVPPPEVPRRLGIKAWLFTREHFDIPKRITTYPFMRLEEPFPFNATQMTFFITHGFEQDANEPWLRDMKSAILNTTEANVLIGQWGGGSKTIAYFQATADTRIAARQFSNMLQYFINHHGLNVTYLHLIGHSLGAQICGLIGKSIPGIQQITALDPAQPLYQSTHDSVRVSKSDANFVVDVHSDARIFLPDVGFGFMDEVGHNSFYVNGGHGQPQCQNPKIEKRIPPIDGLTDFGKPMFLIFKEALLCPHASAVDIMIEAIAGRDCIFWGHAVTMSNMLRGTSNIDNAGFFSQYLAAEEKPCGPTTCSPLGLDTYFWPARGTFVLITRASAPYCIYQEAVTKLEDQRDFIITFQNFIIEAAEYIDGITSKAAKEDEDDE